MLIPPLPPTPSTTCSRHSQLKDPELSDKNSQYLVGQGNRTRTHMHTHTHARRCSAVISELIHIKENQQTAAAERVKIREKKGKVVKAFCS